MSSAQFTNPELTGDELTQKLLSLDDDLMAREKGRPGEVRADEPRSARDEHAHAW